MAATDKTLAEYCESQKQMMDNCDQSGYSAAAAAAVGAATGNKGQTLVEYCQAQKQMMDNCDQSGYSAASAAAVGAATGNKGQTLVEYCQAQKELLETKCKDVSLKKSEVATGLTLWQKCKKELQPDVGIVKAVNSQGM